MSTVFTDEVPEIPGEYNPHHRRSTMEELIAKEKEIEDLEEKLREKEGVIKNQLEEIKALENRICGGAGTVEMDRVKNKLVKREYILDLLESIISSRNLLD